MVGKRKRGQNFGADEKERLLKLLARKKDTILNKKTDGTANEAKNRAWLEVTNAFNAAGTYPRSKHSLMKVWEKLKSKHYFQLSRRDMTGTGGGLSQVKVDPILEQVCTLLGQADLGIEGVLDSDVSLFENYEMSAKDVGTEDGCNLYVLEGDISQETFNMIPAEPFAAASTSEAEKLEDINIPKTPSRGKEGIEEVREELLQEELNFKKKLYALQLEAAGKDVEIKNTILEQLKGGSINMHILLKATSSKHS